MVKINALRARVQSSEPQENRKERDEASASQKNDGKKRSKKKRRRRRRSEVECQAKLSSRFAKGRLGSGRKFSVKSSTNGNKVTHFRFIDRR